MLHAWRLGFHHPITGEWVQNEAPIPDEFDPWLNQVTQRLAQIRTMTKTTDIDQLW